MSEASRVRELFYQALPLESAERKQLLDATAMREPSLAREVASLLQAGSRASSVLPATDVLWQEAGRALAPLHPGAEIGAWRIVAPLGQGGMGTVYHALHRATGRTAALKTVQATEGGMLQAIRREIHVLERLSHPGVVRVLDEGLHEGIPWYCMELLEARPWDDAIRERTDGEARGAVPRPILTLFHRLCAPLSYIHEQGVVHRDLKPSNVLVRPDGRPVLVDFGMTALHGGRGRERLDLSPAGGTVAYVAPEQARGDAVDARADIYSLGCMLYEAIAGVRPFVGKTPAEVLEKRFAEAPPPPSHRRGALDEELDELVLHMLEREPRKRIGHAEEVAAALERLGAEGDDSVPRSAGPRYLFRPGLTGREAELGAAARHVDDLREGRGGMLVIEGESGVGKTRLVAEVAMRAAFHGVQVLAGECATTGAWRQSADDGIPIQGLRRPLQSIADHCRELGPEEARRILGDRAPLLAAYEPAIGSLAPSPTVEVPELPPTAARLRLFNALTQTLHAFAARRPLLLVIEDLQWADDLLLGWLRLWLSDPSHGPLLVVTTLRSEEATREIDTMIASGGVAHLRLDRLPSGPVHAIACDMLGMECLPQPFLERVHENTEGNPFFVGEYLRAAVEEGAVRRGREGSYRIEASHVPFPASPREFVRRRIDALSPWARAIADLAALMGRESSCEVLMAAADIDQARFWEACSELVVRQVMEDAPGGRIRFLHDKLREVTLEAITAGSRPPLHRRIAMALQAVYSDREGDHLSALGHHCEGAGEDAAAQRFYQSAATRAQRMGAIGEVERLYRAYLALEKAPTQESIIIRQDLAEGVLHFSGRQAEAKAELEVALGAARRIGDRHAEASVLCSVALLHWKTAQAREAKALYEQALAIYRELRSHHVGYVLDQLGALLCEMGQRDLARTHLEEALVVCRQSGRRKWEGHVLHHLASVESDPLRAVELGNAALAIHRETGDVRYEGFELANLANLALGRGELEEALELCQQALDAHRRCGNRMSEGVALGMLSGIHYELGHAAEAREIIQRALRLHRENAYRIWESVDLANLAVMTWEGGDPSGAEPLLERAAALAKDVGHPWSETAALAHLGSLRLALHRVGDAEAALRRALEIPGGSQNERGCGQAMIGLARIERHRGRYDEAAELLRRARSLLLAPSMRKLLALLLVEEGHLQLCEGRSAREICDRASEATSRGRRPPPGDVLAAIERLERAQSGFESGVALVHGELPADLPPILDGRSSDERT